MNTARSTQEIIKDIDTWIVEGMVQETMFRLYSSTAYRGSTVTAYDVLLNLESDEADYIYGLEEEPYKMVEPFIKYFNEKKRELSGCYKDDKKELAA